MKESEGLYRSFRFLKKALLALAVVLIGVLLFGYFFFMRHVDAPKAWVAAERELQGDMLHYGEKVQRKSKVFMRRPSDYYRGANGILYATNDRLIFIGVAPGSKFENADAPPMIVSQEFPNDTLLDLEHNLLMFFTGYSRNATVVLDDQKKRSLHVTADIPVPSGRVHGLYSVQDGSSSVNRTYGCVSVKKEGSSLFQVGRLIMSLPATR